jgi:hypothetical protein
VGPRAGLNILRRAKAVAIAGIRTPGRAASSLVTILTTLTLDGGFLILFFQSRRILGRGVTLNVSVITSTFLSVQHSWSSRHIRCYVCNSVAQQNMT